MKIWGEVRNDRYTEVDYVQFAQPKSIKLLWKVGGIICLPIVYTLVLLAKASEYIFRTISELLSLLPFALGVIVRYEFYRRILCSCGENVIIGFGTVFYYRDISIGNNVLIGMYNTIHYCDFGNDVLTAEGCRFLSGSKYHNFDRVDIPMNRQGGQLKRIRIGDDTWIGANSVVMESVGEGCVIGAGAVVTKEVEPYSICVGNPARVIRKRR